jgi:hypothetical protein
VTPPGIKSADCTGSIFYLTALVCHLTPYLRLRLHELQEVATDSCWETGKPSILSDKYHFVSFPWYSIARVCGLLRGYDNMTSKPTGSVKWCLSKKVMILYLVNVCGINSKKRCVSVINSLEMNSESTLRIFGLCKNCVVQNTLLDKVNIQCAGTSWKVVGFK